MKKQVLILSITLQIASVGISQTLNDTVCIPTGQLKAAINLIEKGKVSEQELTLTKKSVNLLENRISLKDSLINLFKLNEEGYKDIITNYKKSVVNYDLVVSNLEKSLTLERIRFRKQTFFKWAGVLIGASLGYLIAKQ